MIGRILDTLGRPDGALHLYSGHDWTVTPLLMAVCRDDEPRLSRWPGFCTSIAFELWSVDPADAGPPAHWPSRGAGAMREDERYVRVLWNGEPVALRCAERGAADERMCRLADFRRSLEAYVVRDFEAECTAGADCAAGQTKRY